MRLIKQGYSSIILLLLLSTVLACKGQNLKEDRPVTASEINLLVHQIADSLERYYVDLEKGIKTGEKLLANSSRGNYQSIIEPKVLAQKLTEDLRSVYGDKHLSLMYRPISVVPSANNKNVDKSGVWTNYGLQEIKVLEGNVAYLKIKHFSSWSNRVAAREAIDKTMNVLNNSEALILDVRDNKGGYPHMVSYLISYLFEGERIHITDYVHRFNNGGYPVYTYTDLPGKKMPNIPVYVLVNEHTASAGEELAFWLKHLKRATIIGETTMGAGYGAMQHRLNDRFVVSISSEEAISPHTTEKIELLGVKPDIKIEKEKAFNESYRLALEYLRENNKSLDALNYDDLIREIVGN